MKSSLKISILIVIDAMYHQIIKMTLRSVSMLSEDCVDSDNNFSAIQVLLQKHNCKMSSKLMLRHCENMKRTKKFRQSPTLTACQNSAKTTLIFFVFFIIFTLSGKTSISNFYFHI